jgi:hypothetical protein
MVVPSGVIGLWAGTNASVPASWPRVTALDSLYVKGIPTASTEPGTSGGTTTHSHVGSAHTHATDHNHPLADVETDGSSDSSLFTSAGGGLTAPNHDHGITIATAVGTSGSAGGQTSGTGGHELTRVAVIFVKSNGSADVPASAVVFYKYASDPTNFTLCDGIGGRPNIVGNFIKGATAGGDGGGTTNRDDHIHTYPHSHTGNIHNHGTVTIDATPSSSRLSGAGTTLPATNHTHASISPTNSSHALPNPADIANSTQQPLNRTLRPIQNTSGVAQPMPVGGIAFWDGALSGIPSDWLICDGTQQSPNMLDHYVYPWNATIGLPAGSQTHTHATHAHISTATGAHGIDGFVTGAVVGLAKNTGGSSVAVSALAHAHTMRLYTNHSGPTNSFSTVSNEPPFKTLAFIQQVVLETAVTSISGSAAITAKATVIKAVKSAVAATALITVKASPQRSAKSAILGSASVTAVATNFGKPSVIINADAAVTALATNLVSAKASLAGSAEVTALAEAGINAKTTISAEAAVTAVATHTVAAQASLSGSASVIGTPSAFRAFFPDGDLSSGTWLPSIGADLWDTINEIPYDDSDYDFTPVNPVDVEMDLSLTDGPTPGVGLVFIEIRTWKQT